MKMFLYSSSKNHFWAIILVLGSKIWVQLLSIVDDYAIPKQHVIQLFLFFILCWFMILALPIFFYFSCGALNFKLNLLTWFQFTMNLEVVQHSSEVEPKKLTNYLEANSQIIIALFSRVDIFSTNYSFKAYKFYEFSISVFNIIGNFYRQSEIAQLWIFDHHLCRFSDLLNIKMSNHEIIKAKKTSSRHQTKNEQRKRREL